MTAGRRPRASRTGRRVGLGATLLAGVVVAGCTPWQPGGDPSNGVPLSSPEERDPTFPWHRDIPATTFWVGEIFDPDAPDGSQAMSTYDSRWMESYGGCDGVVVDGACETEARSVADGWFPTSMIPRENPFYLDLPYDDIHDPTGFAMRDEVVPWADEPPYSSHVGDRGFSYLKNRWVELVHDGRRCFGQVQDAGPGRYDDAAYVFGDDDARPANERFGGAGLDVSPALTGCLGFADLDGVTSVDWRFVEARDVPLGPWTLIVTTSQVR